MRYFILFAILMYCVNSVYSQVKDNYFVGESVSLKNYEGKPVISFEAIDGWERFGTNPIKITNDGQFFQYTIYNQSRREYSVVIQSTKDSWLRTFNGIKMGFFSGDSKRYIAQIGDTICIITLGGDSVRYIKYVRSFMQTEVDRTNWLAYQLEDNTGVVLYNIFDGKERLFFNYSKYSFDLNGHWLICQSDKNELLLFDLINGSESKYLNVTRFSISNNGSVLLIIQNRQQKERLLWINLRTRKSKVIWSAKANEKIISFAIDASSTQVAYTLQRNIDNKNENSIWYFNQNKGAVMKVNDQTIGIDTTLTVGKTSNFSQDGNYLIFSLEQKSVKQTARVDGAKVDIWNYKDTFLQSSQVLSSKVKSRMAARPYNAIIGIGNSKVIQLTKLNEEGGIPISNRYALVSRRIPTDRFWEEYATKDSVWLVSLKDGNRKFIRKDRFDSFRFSIKRRYLVFFDEESGHYFSYDLKFDTIANISAKVPYYLGSENKYDQYTKFNNRRTGFAGWLSNDEGVLVYDSYDIWCLDLSGKNNPINVTNGYGRAHGIIMRLTGGQYNNPSVIKMKSSILLTGFNVHTKENGFLRKTFGDKGDPQLLYMGPYLFDINGGLLPNDSDAPGVMRPVKAKDAEIWIVQRQSAREAPNYYFTKDLITYRLLTSLNPQKNYNWLTTQLIAFKQMDGSKSEGILYKPENFDSTKKYPLLLNYYWQSSHRLNEFPTTSYTCNGDIDIPWFVSRGYLVFKPDIYFNSERPRPASALNTVEGAARYLSQFSWVDSGRIGIAGHSQGGGYTNYILTHSKLFAAVFEGAGVSDWVSSQLQLVYNDGTARLSDNQQEPFIWERTSVFMDNPIINTLQVSSPLLIMHNKLDGAVPWEQAVELFLVLRRLGKKVWMLQYDDDFHNLTQLKNAQDLTIRVTQFFNYYLKGLLPPMWMTTGVPANLKGIETGLGLDASGRQP